MLDTEVDDNELELAVIDETDDDSVWLLNDDGELDDEDDAED